MGSKYMTVEDFANDGFEIYDESPKPKKVSSPVAKPAPVVPAASSKVIIIDNKEVLTAVKESNDNLQTGLKQLVYAMETKPNSFTLDIERDNQGFMKKIKVNLNK